MDKITATYNFVPLSRKVFFPDWADQVSHDLPFVDGISGELVCELTTHTPIYVRNGGKWEHDDIMIKKDAQSFFYVKQGNQRHFMIPGTTLKGMLRNVIEIASFGKMNKVDNHRFSVRDLHNKELYTSNMKNIQAGWLKNNAAGFGWEITPCDFALVSHEMLKNESIKAQQNSLSKYKKWGWENLTVAFKFKKGSIANRVTTLSEGSSGRLVFTGQPTANTGGKFHKKNEFVFFGEQANSAIAVTPDQQKDFCFIYTDPNTGKPYEEWAHWQNELNQGGKVPVFFQLKGGQLGSFGFTRMYRLPYEYKVHDAIRHVAPVLGNDHFHQDPDLAETIFGFIDGNRDSLKGRVSVSAALATEIEPEQWGMPLQAVLGSPKPTFYPNYISQPAMGADGRLSGNYKTFMDGDGTVSGWKRYPTRLLKDVINNPDQGTDKVATRLIPLKEGACFTFTVKLHNLKPLEVGAIIWALTWGGDETLCHSLGMGKSRGFGVASIDITGATLSDMSNNSITWLNCMQNFTKAMDDVVGGDWKTSLQLEQLLAMANPRQMPQCGRLNHMSLAAKDFNTAKGSSKPPRPSLALLPHVRPTAVKDADRFKNLKPREKRNLRQSSAPREGVAPVSAAPVIPASPADTWPTATLTFDNSRGELKAVYEGKNAICKRTPEAESIIARIRKKGHVTAPVSVELIGGNNYRIIRIDAL